MLIPLFHSAVPLRLGVIAAFPFFVTRRKGFQREPKDFLPLFLLFFPFSKSTIFRRPLFFLPAAADHLERAGAILSSVFEPLASRAFF